MYEIEDQISGLRWLGRQTEGVFDKLFGFGELRVVGVVKSTQSAAGFDRFTDLRLQDDADSRVDRGVDVDATRAEHGGGFADVVGTDAADVAVAGRIHHQFAGGVRQELELVDDLRIAALRLNDLL